MYVLACWNKKERTKLVMYYYAFFFFFKEGCWGISEKHIRLSSLGLGPAPCLGKSSPVSVLPYFAPFHLPLPPLHPRLSGTSSPSHFSPCCSFHYSHVLSAFQEPPSEEVTLALYKTISCLIHAGDEGEGRGLGCKCLPSGMVEMFLSTNSVHM